MEGLGSLQQFSQVSRSLLKLDTLKILTVKLRKPMYVANTRQNIPLCVEVSCRQTDVLQLLVSFTL